MEKAGQSSVDQGRLLFHVTSIGNNGVVKDKKRSHVPRQKRVDESRRDVLEKAMILQWNCMEGGEEATPSFEIKVPKASKLLERRWWQTRRAQLC